MTALAVCLVVSSAWGGTPGSVPSVEDMLAAMEGLNPGLRTLIADQEILLSVMGLRFSASATVYVKRPDKYRIVFRRMPWILSHLQPAITRLQTPRAFVAEFRITRIAPVLYGGEPAYHLTGVPQVNPGDLLRVEVVVVASMWTIPQVTLVYRWGTVVAAFTYDRIEGFLVPVELDVRLIGIPVILHSTYKHFRFNVDLPDELFFDQPGSP